MIIEEINSLNVKEDEKRKIFKMLKDVKLPKHYKFVDDCIELRFIRWWTLSDKFIASIYLNNDSSLDVIFEEKEDLEDLRHYFQNSKTKFRLSVGWFY